MRKLTFTLSLLMLSHLLMAQPVLNNNLNYAIGDSFRLNGYLEVFNISPGPAGANVVWDFETIVGGDFFESSPEICVDPSTTPFADSAAVLLSDIAIKTIPTEPDEPAIYQYVKSKSDAREYVAMGMLLGDNYGSYGSFQDAWIDLVFPLEYGDSFDFTVESLLFSLEEGYYYWRDSTYVTVVADAWGSITTPAGHFPNVLRLKQTEVSHAWFRFDVGEPWEYLYEMVFISYHWYAANIKTPVMVLHEYDWKKVGESAGFYSHPSSMVKTRALMNNNPVAPAMKRMDYEYSVIYLAEYDWVGIPQTQKPQFNIFPNPAKNIVNIRMDQHVDVSEILIYNLNGQEVLKSSGNKHSIDVSSLKPGLYFIELGRNDILMRKKLVIH